MNALGIPSTWPLWRRRRFATDSQRIDEFVALARYATTDALRGFNEPDNVVPGLAVPEMLSRVYQTFVRSRWVYVEEPKRPAPLASGATQQIRAPRDVERYRAATCLDASLLFVALALRAGARPLVVIGRSHAFVIVGDRVTGTPSGTTGISFADATTVELTTGGQALAIDVVQALRSLTREEPEAFERAGEVGARLVATAVRSGSPLTMIDVARVNETQESTPHIPDADLTFIPRSLPADAGELPLYKNQSLTCSRLSGKHGVLVIHGSSGSGKTTAALHLAAAREAGPSLLLDASSGETVVASAANIAARERGTSADRLEPQERDGEAAALLARLRTAPGPWCVVFDNADGDPSKVLPRLPRPDAAKGQVVIVTTTNPSWLRLNLVDETELLSPIDDVDVEAALGEHRELKPLVEGRAVTLRAFLRYLRKHDSADLLGHADNDAASGLQGPIALVRAVLARHSDLRPALRRLTLLPPDYLPVDDDVADSETLRRLEALGLVDFTPHTGIAQMHRLIGSAAEHVLGSEDEGRAAADLVRHQGSFNALSMAADPTLLARYTKLILEAFSGPAVSVEDGEVLQQAASLMELRGRVEDSYKLAGPAVDALSAAEGTEPIALADALQSRARWTNQQRARDANALTEARAQMELAQRVAARHGDERRAARSRRLDGLLRLKQGWLNKDRAAGTQEIVDALADLEHEANLAELPGSGVDAGEALRARFNVAGPRVTLAQRFPTDAAEHLTEADRTYTRVRAGRQALYPQTQHPHVAACISGQALVRYMQANLVAVAFDARQQLLREASDLEHEALTDRFDLEGPLGGGDTSKSSRLLTKIGYARHRLNDSGVASPVLREAGDEVLLPRMTAATTDLHAFAKRWFGSPQLAAVLTLFDAASPAELDKVPGERLVDVLETRTILSAARALGLMDTELPIRRVFDDLIVIDGPYVEQAKAFADKLIAGGEVSARRVLSTLESLDGTHVVLVTPHIDRLRRTAEARRLTGRAVDAIGFEPNPGSTTFRPLDYLQELSATARVLQDWLD
ncbi:hypothetical protein OJ998_22300 [Solirubrobacter taibaiensis]|nr:hypothetical protein [Solirubrobacter taibaiensis]